MTTSELEKSIATLPMAILPEGTLIRPRYAKQPRYWISDEPFFSFGWGRLRALHPRTGLWPVFLHGDEDEPDRPWVDGEVGELRPLPPEEYDVAAVLGQLWDEHTEPVPDDSPVDAAEMAAETLPYGRVWPGLAPAMAIQASADEVADDFASRLINSPDTRLGMVPVTRSADVPALTGWQGASEYLPPAALSAVLRSWEDRFGVRLIRIGSSSLVLSVTAPPTTPAEALPVAAEHFALCRDNISYGAGALIRYAEELIGVQHWSFWWDPSTSANW
jgi:hypothetical protein